MRLYLLRLCSFSSINPLPRRISEDFVFRDSLYFSGHEYRVTVTEETLRTSPAWKDTADDPPLSARKAMKLANEKKLTFVKDFKDWKWDLSAARLKRSPDGKWFWVVEYESHPADPDVAFSGMPPDLSIVVLMDGTVIVPKLVKD